MTPHEPLVSFKLLFISTAYFDKNSFSVLNIASFKPSEEKS